MVEVKLSRLDRRVPVYNRAREQQQGWGSARRGHTSSTL